MTRNITESIISIFDYLESRISDEDKRRVITVNSRRFYPSEKSKVSVLTKSKVEPKLLLNYKLNMYGITLENESFVFVPGKSKLTKEFSPGFTLKASDDIELSQGFKLLAMSMNLVELKPEMDLSLRLIDKVFGLEPDAENIVWYDVDQILSFYSEFEVWSIEKDIFDVEDENDLYRIYLLWRISNENGGLEKHQFSLNFSFKTLEQFVKLTQNPNSKYIAKVLFRSITSTNWEHCYLELYRCIENLYTVYDIDYLHNRLNADTNEIAASLDNIGFRSKELVSVTRLFKKINTNQYLINDLKREVFSGLAEPEKISVSQDVLNILKELVHNRSSKSEDNINLVFNKLEEEFEKTTQHSLLEVINKMAEKLYLIRCSIAHLKYKHNYFEFEDSKWDTIVYTTLKIIEELYDLYGRRLDELNIV